MAEPVGILRQIADAKRDELAIRYDGVSLDALRERAQPTKLSLAAVLAKAGARFILEIKKASPSAGAIRPKADSAALARGYAGVADALSVLCDRSYFGGSLDDLTAARSEFDGPILMKDFVIEKRQVAESRIAGADALLVMLSLLGDHEAREIIAEARRFGMDALVEVHDESEMRRALSLGAPLIGINNRDLRDLSVDLSSGTYLRPDEIVRTELRRRYSRRPASGVRGSRVRARQPPPRNDTGSRAAGRSCAQVWHSSGRNFPRCSAPDRFGHCGSFEPARGATSWA